MALSYGPTEGKAGRTKEHWVVSMNHRNRTWGFLALGLAIGAGAGLAFAAAVLVLVAGLVTALAAVLAAVLAAALAAALAGVLFLAFEADGAAFLAVMWCRALVRRGQTCAGQG